MQKNLPGIIAIVLLLGVITPGFADTSDRDELNAPDVRGTQRKVAQNSVTWKGKTVFLIPEKTGGLSAEERTSLIQDRLEDIEAHYVVGPEDVNVFKVGADRYTITVSGEPIVTVEPELTQAAGLTDPAQLAKNWAGSLRQSLERRSAPNPVAFRKRDKGVQLRL